MGKIPDRYTDPSKDTLSYFSSPEEQQNKVLKAAREVPLIKCPDCKEENRSDIASIKSENIVKKLGRDLSFSVAAPLAILLISSPHIAVLVFIIEIHMISSDLRMEDIENWSSGQFKKKSSDGKIECINGHTLTTARYDHLSEDIINGFKNNIL